MTSNLKTENEIKLQKEEKNTQLKTVVQFASRLTDKLHFDDARIKITELWTFFSTDLPIFFSERKKNSQGHHQ